MSAIESGKSRDSDRGYPGTGLLLQIYAAEIKQRFSMLQSTCNQLEDLRGTWIWTDAVAKEVEKLQKQLAATGDLISKLIAISRLAEVLEMEMREASNEA